MVDSTGKRQRRFECESIRVESAVSGSVGECLRACLVERVRWLVAFQVGMCQVGKLAVWLGARSWVELERLWLTARARPAVGELALAELDAAYRLAGDPARARPASAGPRIGGRQRRVGPRKLARQPKSL